MKKIRLESQCKRYDVEEGVQARLKDPLWMLGRQRQMGEFQATNGGHPVRFEATYQKCLLDNLKKRNRGDFQQMGNPNVPLEKYVEEGEGEDTAWDSKHLEYRFQLCDADQSIQLSANEYSGRELDWYQFSLDHHRPSPRAQSFTSVVPVPLKYPGMPSARWWSFEEGRMNLGDLSRPHYNLLTMLLIEFGLNSSPDWFTFPLEHEVGYSRSMDSVVAIDSFGWITTVSPTVDETSNASGFELFTLARTEEGVADPTFFYFPNTLSHGLESKPCEEVSFFRDEIANLVWAIEHRVEDENGKIQVRREEIEESEAEQEYYWDEVDKKLIEMPNGIEGAGQGENVKGPIPRYVLKRVPPPYWIPYLQRQCNGEIVLRRGKTYPLVQQFKGKFLKESVVIMEEEIPRAGIKIVRKRQLARTADKGEVVTWTGNAKLVDQPQPFSNLSFDQIESK